MRDARVWHALLGVEKTVIEDVEFDEVAEVLVGLVRPARGVWLAGAGLQASLRQV